jgi:hypothetical protein
MVVDLSTCRRTLARVCFLFSSSFAPATVVGGERYSETRLCLWALLKRQAGLEGDFAKQKLAAASRIQFSARLRLAPPMICCSKG